MYREIYCLLCAQYLGKYHGYHLGRAYRDHLRLEHPKVFEEGEALKAKVREFKKKYGGFSLSIP